ncbi:hypothetical protein BD412_000877 [Thermoanaerobacterium thermosaccharolyticum]|jgi:hypothetical protein|nr:hypothetical protein [Thermoanaerobacterium thermosaccharolyticum]
MKPGNRHILCVWCQILQGNLRDERSGVNLALFYIEEGF